MDYVNDLGAAHYDDFIIFCLLRGSDGVKLLNATSHLSHPPELYQSNHVVDS